MQNITLNVTDEERLYNSLDPRRNLLNNEVKDYLLNQVQIEGPKNGVNLIVSSTIAIDEERFTASIDRWIQDEEQTIRAAARRNAIQQVWMFGIGVLFIALSLMLQPTVGVVWFTVLSTIGAFSMWEAASIWIIQNPKLRMRKRAISRLKERFTLSFVNTSNDSTTG